MSKEDEMLTQGGTHISMAALSYKSGNVLKKSYGNTVFVWLLCVTTEVD